MAAMLDLRVCKLGLLVASIVLMFSAIGVMVFGTKLAMIPANAVPVLSIMVWLASVLSAIRRRFRSSRPGDRLAEMRFSTITTKTPQHLSHPPIQQTRQPSMLLPMATSGVAPMLDKSSKI
jgi:hypothetical protein